MKLLKMNRRELDAEVGQHRLKDAVTKTVGLLSKNVTGVNFVRTVYQYVIDAQLLL